MVRLNSLLCLGVAWPVLLGAQQTPEINQILERLDKLERENLALTEQVQQLRTQLAASSATGAAKSTRGGAHGDSR